MKLVYGFKVRYVDGVTIAKLHDTVNSPEGVLVAEDTEGRETVRMSLEQVPVAGWPSEFEEWRRLNPPIPSDKLAKWYAPRIVQTVELQLSPDGGKTFSLVPHRYAE